MYFTLISPRIVIQKSDFLGSGVPYWPTELAILASFIRSDNDHVNLIDLFGNNPRQLDDMGDHYLQGDKINPYLNEIKKTDYIFIYALSYMSHKEINSLIIVLKKHFPKKKIVIMENSQAVTGYSLQSVSKDFFDSGADYVLCGEPYFNWQKIKDFISKKSNVKPKNIMQDQYTIPERFIKKNAKYPLPAWDLVNLENYWSLPYSHGPKTRKYLPFFSSRGCPYPCDFCVVPETNNRRWRATTSDNVVDELIELKNKYGVSDFQIEDLNPTVNHERWEAICDKLIEKKTDIRFYFVSGTKAETIHLTSVSKFAKAGCKYISISPESGSESLMKKIGKKFDYDHGIKLISLFKKYGIKSQTCFLVGHPDETKDDFNCSKKYLKKLVIAGLDEVAVFIVSPFAGSKIFNADKLKFEDKDAVVTFSPRGRSNYLILEKRRRELIVIFLINKIFYNFSGFLNQIFHSLLGTPTTKLENLPKRFIYINYLKYLNWIKNIYVNR